VLSRLNLTAEKSYSKDSEMEFCQSSQSGTMCKPSMETRGEEKLISSAEDSHAKTYQQQEKEQELKDQDQVCGNTWRESSVKFDLDTLSWKTHQCLWEEDLLPSSLTLPKWGMMRSGALLERIMSPLLIDETEFGLWPTPCTNGMNGGSNSRKAAKKRGMWPTPRAQEPGRTTEGYGRGLAELIEGKTQIPKRYPTPTCHNAKECDSPAEANRNTPTLCHVARGGDKTQPKHLNPTWVEWLMGWPLGWTDLKPLEMDKFLLWLKSHGKY
jgi:hypothetical protein